MKKSWMIIFVSICMAICSKAQTEYSLYPWGKIPNFKKNELREATRDIGQGNKFIYNTTHPTITAYLADESVLPNPAIIIFPGGGYAGVSVTAEGEAIAKAFNKIGVSAFIVKYRMPSELSMADKQTGPLQDAKQAILMVRRNAARWNIDPQRTGVIGFSAGGHLASCLSTLHQKNLLDSQEDTALLRPDFTILIYPVISMIDSLTHKGSKTNLLGKNPSVADVRMYSSEMQVNGQTPPAILIHAADDTAVSAENSIQYFRALHKHGISAQLIIYPKGGHGFGLENSTTKDQWIERCRDWMRANSWL